MILRKPAGRRLAEVVFANEVRNGGVGGRAGLRGPKLACWWGPGRRLMGREGICIDILWANVELIVDVAGLNLAGWAVAWRQVGRIWPKVG